MWGKAQNFSYYSMKTSLTNAPRRAKAIITICFTSELFLWLRFLKCPYYGFLKITFHAVCNTALSEWKHPAKFKSESAPCIKLLSIKRKSRLWIIETSRFKTNPSRFMLTSKWNIAYCPPTCCMRRPGKTWFSRWYQVGMNENINSFFATRCRFWSVKSSQTLL